MYLLFRQQGLLVPIHMLRISISELYYRDPKSSLALSSRNAYLTSAERDMAAPTLYAALQAARQSWEAGLTKLQSIANASRIVEQKNQQLSQIELKIDMRLDYIEMNDPDSFEIVSDDATISSWDTSKGRESCENKPVILSGAMWVGTTRLIDNIILGDPSQLGITGISHQ